MSLQNTIKFSGVRLWLETAFWRHGLLPFAAVLVVVLGALTWLLWVPKTMALIDTNKHRLAALEAQVRNGSLKQTKIVPPLVVFEQTLSDPAKTNDVIKRIFELAHDSGVTISQADYRRISDRENTQNTQSAQASQISVSQFQIALPVKGGYAALKHFCLSLLAELPALSIDQLSLKREASNSNQVNAQLLLTLWERGSPVGPVAKADKP